MRLSRSLLLKAIWITSLPLNALLDTRVPSWKLVQIDQQDEFSAPVAEGVRD
jgi:hypothetical protein